MDRLFDLGWPDSIMNVLQCDIDRQHTSVMEDAIGRLAECSIRKEATPYDY